MSLLLDIFYVFFRISMLSFGGVFGVLPELERMIVEERGWMTHERFIESYVFGQFVPGPNMAMCPLIGYWVAGLPGGLAAFLGIYSGPVIIMSAIYFVYSRYKKIGWVKRSELALRPLVFGLIASSMLNIVLIQSKEAPVAALLLIGLCSFIYYRKHLDPLVMIFLAGFLWLGYFSLTSGV